MLKKATQQQTKKHNKRLVLKTIYDGQAISRANVARQTHLTRTTVSSIVAELIEERLVQEVGVGPSRGGKPPILLSTEDSSHQVIGIDLGNSELRGGVADLRGNLLHSHSLALGARRGTAAVELVYTLIDDLLPAVTGSLIGIGVGTPGITDAHTGLIYEAVNLGWLNLPLKGMLAARYARPVLIANDSQVAALGEYTFGSSRGIPNLIFVKVGQGISAGIVLDGHLYSGDSSGPGEIGHVMVAEGGDRCTCGHNGCLETIASSRAIIERAQAVARTNPDSLLHQSRANGETIDTDVVLQAVEAGDQSLSMVISEVGCYLGVAVAHLVAILNIQHIVIGGRIARFGETLLGPIRSEVNRRVLKRLADETQIVIDSLGEDAVIKGAAALVLSHELGVV